MLAAALSGAQKTEKSELSLPQAIDAQLDFKRIMARINSNWEWHR